MMDLTSMLVKCILKTILKCNDGFCFMMDFLCLSDTLPRYHSDISYYKRMECVLDMFLANEIIMFLYIHLNGCH